tara:strand:- start:480 stop:2549 length:2070 start_codon:yes stop_codon:yes gene_type:complete
MGYGRTSSLGGYNFDLTVLLRSLFTSVSSSSNVVVIGLDEVSLMESELEVGNSGYALRELPRGLLQPAIAELINGLMENEKSGPNRLGFDIFFVWRPELFMGQFDKILRSAIFDFNDSDKIILGRGKRPLSKPYSEWDNVGGALFIPDDDGVLRRGGSHSKVEKGDAEPTFSALLSGKCDISSTAPEMECGNIPKEFMLLQNSSLTAIPAYRLADVLSCLREPDCKSSLLGHLRDKIVLVGTTWPGEDIKISSDRFFTRQVFEPPSIGGRQFGSPIAPHERGTPGVFVHGALIDAMLTNRMPVQVSSKFIAGLTFITSILMASLALLLGPVILSGVFLVGVGTLILGGMFALEFNWWVPTWMPIIATLSITLLTYTFRYVTEDRSKRQLRRDFAHYLSPQIIDRLATAPGRLTLGGETKMLSVMFSDIRGFTTISEQYQSDPEGLIALVNQYLDPLTQSVLEHGGTIDKYIGDSIMAFWNAPMDIEDHELRSCRAALDMQRKINALNQGLMGNHGLDGSPHTPLHIGIGINTGSCVVGNLGSKQRFDYSVLGDAVNLASRLEGQTRGYGVHILIGPETAQALGERLLVLPLGKIAVMGKAEAVEIHTLLDSEGLGHVDDVGVSKSRHEAILKEYGQQCWDEAEGSINSALGSFEGRMDGYYKMLLERIRNLREAPPGDDWDGVYSAETK